MRKTRLPGPIQNSAPIGNSADLVGIFTTPWVSLDPTSSGWALSNPLGGVINSVTVDASGIRFQLEYDNKHRRWNQTTQDSPRYYKQLQGDRGPLTWADKFTIEFLAWRTAVDANASSGGQDDAGFVIGIADSSCISDTSDVEWVGCGCYNKKSSAQEIIFQAGGDTAITTVQNTGFQRGYIQINPPFDEQDDADGNPAVHRVTVNGLDLNNRFEGQGVSGDQNHPDLQFVGTDPVYLFLAPTYRSSTSGLSDPDFTWKIWYRISEDPERFEPQYTPNQG